MELKDRTVLAAAMREAGLSARQLSQAAGWRSHSYMNRLLSGQVKTLSTVPAVRIAYAVKMPLDVLFLTKVEAESIQSGKDSAA